MTIQYRYGGLTHEDGEVVDHRITQVAHHTKRSWRDTAVMSVELHIQVIKCTEAEVNARVDEILGYYIGNNDVKWGIYLSDGSESLHIIDPADPRTIRGPMVVDARFKSGSQEEMVVKREFSITLEWLYLCPESEIIEYEEKITHYGNGGGAWRMQNVVNGPPRDYWVWPATSMIIVQEGTSKGLEGYYLTGSFPHPLIPPQWEHQEQRIITPGKPLHLGNRFLYYPWHWRFVFEVPVYTLAIPV